MTTPERQTEKKGYGGASETAAVRGETIGQIVSSQAALLTKACTKADLSDTEAVREIAEALMQKCAALGCLPNFELLSAALGLSRRALYKYLENHPDDETARFLDQLRTAWAGMRVMAMDRGVSDVTAGIFVLLNSNLGFSNQHTVEITQPQNPIEVGLERVETIRARYIEALPEEDERSEEA